MISSRLMTCEDMPVIPDGYRLIDEPPDIDEYLRLRADSGLTPKNRDQGLGAVSGSWSFCHVRSREGDAVAMGRVIGDGGWYFHIADVATLPGHQRRGLGRIVLLHLLEGIRSRVPAGAYVTLIADAPGRVLYESAGFVESAPRGLGMQMLL